MSPRALTAIAVGSLLLLAVPGEVQAGATQQNVRGKLEAVDAESEAKGKFRIGLHERGERSRERLVVKARGLETTADPDGNAPQYHVWLIDTEDAAADMGAMRLRRRGGAVLRFSTRRADLPDGVESLEQFGGGTIEVRLGDEVVLRGDVPTFLGVGDDETPDARVRAHASERLLPGDETSRARGVISVAYKNRPAGTDEKIVVEVVRAGRPGDTFDVVVVPSEGEELALGSLRLRGRIPVGFLRLGTARGDEIPGGSVLDLAGLTVEVRDADGAVVLSGTFPEL